MSKKTKIVKYSNEIHEFDLSLKEASQQNVLFTLMAVMPYIEGNTIELSFAEFFKLIGVEEQNANNKKYIIQVAKSLIGEYIHLSTKQRDRVLTIFNEVDANHETRTIKFSLYEGFKEVYLTNLKDNFTFFELKTLRYIRGLYTKTIYRHLMQFRTTGVWSISYEDFRKLLNIPKSYKPRNIDQRVINPAIKELTKIVGMLMIRKIKDGKKIKTLQWIYSPRKYNAELQKAKKQELSLEYIANTMKHEKIVKNVNKNVKDSTKAKEAQKQIESSIQAKTNQNTQNDNVNLSEPTTQIQEVSTTSNIGSIGAELVKAMKEKAKNITINDKYRHTHIKLARENGGLDFFKINQIQKRKDIDYYQISCYDDRNQEKIFNNDGKGFESEEHVINFIEKHKAY